ncbi:MAG: ankyrin repeat domain-containing protein, partial [Pyrinomonadaceae bacterium]
AFIDLQSATLGHTPLMDAVWHKQTSMVKFLLARNAKTSLQSHYKATAMDFAQRDNLADIVKLIEERDRADAALVKKQVLMKAVQKGDLAKVKKAIAEGANVDEKAPMIGNEWDGYTPLHAAAVLGYAAIVHELLAAGANPRIVDGLMHATPGHKAGYNGHAETARALVENDNLELDAQGAYNGLTALHDAVWHGHTETVRVYLEAGARTDLRSATGKTPLELAEQYGYEEIAAMIRAKMNEEAKK